MITPMCRSLITQHDVDYIAAVVSKKESDRDLIASLLWDNGSRDVILDNDNLYRSISSQSADTVRISMELSFYVLCRHELKICGIDDRQIADYTASILCTYTRDTEVISYGRTWIFRDMLERIGCVKSMGGVYETLKIATGSLFLAGIMSDYLEIKKSHKGTPATKEYENLSARYFESAAESYDAEKHQMDVLYSKMSNNCHKICHTLRGARARIMK